MKTPLFKNRFTKKQAKLPTRITNETVAEHRERILAGGRRFKYPIQYARHKLVINTILISVVALVLLIVLTWWQLYIRQNTGTLFYQVTKVLPLPVATVDGQSVRYSDYLLQYRGSEFFSRNIEGINLNSKDGERQKNYYKRITIDNAVADAYAHKLARDNKISVTNEDVEKIFQEHLGANDSKLSERAYDAVIKDQYGWNRDEYWRSLERQLLRQKVSVAVDETARKIRDDIDAQINSDGSNFEQIAEAQGDKVVLEASGQVPRTNADGGRAATAAALNVGQVSDPFISKSIDGYYFIKLIDKNDKQVSYLSIKVPLTEFRKKLESVRKNDGVNEYINIPEIQQQR